MSSAAQSFKFFFRRGATLRVGFKYQTVGADDSRTPIDLSDKTISCHFRRRDGGENILDLRSDAGSARGSAITMTNAAAGEYAIVVTKEETANFPTGFGEWWMLLHEDASGEVYGLQNGGKSYPF